MSKKLILTITAIVAVLIAVVAGLVFLPKAGETPTPTNTNAPTSTAPVTTEPLDVPEDELEINKDIPESELILAKRIFPDAEATKSFSKEQVQIAETVAYEYMNNALGNTYFADGSFEKEGYPIAMFDQYFGKYFDYRTLADIHQRVEDRVSLDSATGTPLYLANLQNLVWFLQLNGGSPEQWLTETCRTGGVTQDGDTNYIASADSPCFVDYPTITNMKYEEGTNSAGVTGIRIDATGVTKPVLVKDGVEGFRTITYNFTLFITPNENSDWANGVHSMVIRGLEPSNPVGTAWEPLT